MPRRARVGYNSPLPNYHARHRSFCRRRAEAIGTHHGVLDISTIDASSCRVHAACFLSQVIAGFSDEQSSATLTDHTSSYCFLCRTYLRFTRTQQHRLKRQSAPSSTIVPGYPSMCRTRPWIGRRSGIDAVPGILRCRTPPDRVNHIYSRRPRLHGEGLGTTGPLGRS